MPRAQIPTILPRVPEEAEPLLGARDESPRPPSDVAKRKLSLGTLSRIAATMFSFAVLGMQISAIGVIIPHLESQYSLNDAHVSVLFLVGPLGYFGAAYLNCAIHLRFGQRGIATLGPLCRLAGAGVACLRPPFPVFLVGHVVASFAAGLLDGSWCAWAGAMENANTVSGFLHGSFSIGAALGPFLCGLVLTNHQPWYAWYYVLAAAALAEFVVLAVAFRHQDAKSYHQRNSVKTAPDASPASRFILSHPATWVCAAYYLAYVGTEMAISGWIVVFMTRVRHATPYLAGACSSGFWAGMAVGRLVLGFVTDRLGVRSSVIGYLLCAMAAQCLFAIVTVPAMWVVLMATLGFFCGPLFPSGVVMLTRLLPRDMHMGAVSFVASVGQIGGALLPFGLGALSQSLGIQIFKVMVLAQLAVSLALWMAFPRPKDEGSDSEDSARSESLENPDLP